MSDTDSDPPTDPKSPPPSAAPTEKADSPLEGLDPRALIQDGLKSQTPPGQWEPPSPEALAALLPQYEIDTLIGRGGMGAVYRGRQAALDRTVAIKLLPAEMASDEQFIARFQREAQTLAKLHHPGIVLVHDFGQTSEGHLFFVMEFVDGTDLHHIIHGPGMDCAQALEVIGQICDALQYAHTQGVMHRDIKPANVLISKDGQAKLADFGLARPLGTQTTQFTKGNVVMGTPDYIAPEALSGESDHRADLYSLGIMLYELLTGRTPRGSWLPPSQRVQVDVRLDQVVIKALQEEPDRRYQQASELKTDVDHIRTTPPAGNKKASLRQPKKTKTPKPKTRHSNNKNTTTWLVAATTAILLAIGLFALINSQSRNSKSAPPIVATPTIPQPDPAVLQAQQRGGKLRVFRTHDQGLLDLGNAADFDDFQTVVLAQGGWAARRTNGSTHLTLGIGYGEKTEPEFIAPFQTSWLQHANIPLMRTTDAAAYRNIWGEGSQGRHDWAHPDSAAFLNPSDHVVTLDKAGNTLFSENWHGKEHTTRIAPPTDFFGGATAYNFTNDCYISARPGHAVKSFNVHSGETTEFPPAIKNIVEIDTSYSTVILLDSEGQVFVTDDFGEAYQKVPLDLGPAIAVRAGENMAAAQMTDGTWRAWGDSHALIEQTQKIGPAIDLDFYSEGKNKPSYMIWIEPTAGSTSSELQPRELASAVETTPSNPREGLILPGKTGPGNGKKIVLIAGDEEYRSEESLPMLAKILSQRHGFDCTVLFALNTRDQHIDPHNQHNIPATETLHSADLLILATRFRDLPPIQSEPITRFLNAGNPIIGIRTATHAFKGEMAAGSWSYENFGPDILGEGWVGHHAKHKINGTRGLIEPQNADHPVLRTVRDVFAPTDVYAIENLRGNETILMRGASTETLDPTSRQLAEPGNASPPPIAWLREYTAPNGETKGTAFCQTPGAAVDFLNEDLRRLTVNAAYFLTGLEVPAKANVEFVDPYTPSFYAFLPDLWSKRQLKPSDFDLGKPTTPIDIPDAPQWQFPAAGSKPTSIDLISLIDPAKDTIDIPGKTGENRWIVDAGKLVFKDTMKLGGKIVVPTSLHSNEYEYEVVVQPSANPSSNPKLFNLDILAHDDSKNLRVTPVAVYRDGSALLPDSGNGTRPQLSAPVRFRDNTQSFRLRLHVTHGEEGTEDRLILQINDNPEHEWTGNFADYSKPVDPHPDHPEALQPALWVYGHDGTQFSKFTLTLFQGELKPLRPE